MRAQQKSEEEFARVAIGADGVIARSARVAEIILEEALDLIRLPPTPIIVPGGHASAKQAKITTKIHMLASANSFTASPSTP
jgi:hypothetical protein